MLDPWRHDRFVLRQQRMGSNVRTWIAPSGRRPAGGEAFCFVERRRTGLREDVWFFTDEGEREAMMAILTRHQSDPRAHHAVITPDELVIGEIQKRLGRSLMRSSYVVFDAAGAEICIIRERRLSSAVARRLLDLVDVLAILLERLRGAPFGTDFDVVRDGLLIGTYRRREPDGSTQIHDIELTADSAELLDRRLAVAACVAVDALQGR